jgi:hypothetical protein
MRRCFDHTPGVAGWTHTTTFAGVRDQEIVLALVAVRSGEAMRKVSTFQVSAKGAFDMGGRCFTVFTCCEFQPGFEVRLGNPIPQRLFGATALVTLSA